MKKVRINENTLRNIVRESIKNIIKEGESYGWVVESSEAQEAYEFACDQLGKEYVDESIVSCLSSDELADNLAFLFRNWDFTDWYEYKEGKEDVY